MQTWQALLYLAAVILLALAALPLGPVRVSLPLLAASAALLAYSLPTISTL
jgi:hypothetical protein